MVTKEKLSFEIELPFREGGKIICGIDEAGRGPLAGPVSAAAVILPDDFDNTIGINDSKKLTSLKRDELFEIIKHSAKAYSIIMSSVEEIEEINILQATISAMKRAVESLNIKPDMLLVDGNYFPKWKINHICIKGGDAKSLSIAAASVLAKVERDKYMVEIAHELYPQYNFAKHKGYGTKEHFEAIKKYGLSPIHRQSYLKKYFAEEKQIKLI
ncbi:MAG: ribonuclease HII [bacterium]